MHAPWQSFREGLRASLRSQRNLLQFERLRASLPGDLDTPDAVVRFLATRDGDDRGPVLRLLAARVQARQADADLAFAILALGRWRDLDMIYGRWRHVFRGDPEEIVSRIRAGFTTAVLGMRLGRSSNLVAGLSISTERPLRKWWKAIKRERNAEYPEWVPKSDGDVEPTPDTSPAGLPQSMSPAARLAILHQIARQAAGDDADIVFAVDVCDEDLHDVATRLDIGYDAARKRYQRAKTRIAKAFQEIGIGPCPRSAATHATTGCKGDGRPGGSR